VCELCSQAVPFSKLCCTLPSGTKLATQDHSHSQVAHFSHGILHDTMSETHRLSSAVGSEGVECPSDIMTSETKIHQTYLACVPGDAAHMCRSVRGTL
jgi:hypothetical protein